MTATHTLTRHRDIQNWVSDRKGLPAIVRVRNSFGETQSELRLRFRREQAAPKETPSQDDGISPCSWAAWLAELDRQHLALKVGGSDEPDFEFVSRRTLN